MKIALAHSFAFPEVQRGTERVVADLAVYMRDRGHSVDVFYGTQRESQFHRGPRGRAYRMRTPRIRALEGYGVYREELFGVRALAPLLLHRYDVVHAFAPSAAVAAIATGTPTVFSVEHDRFPNGLGFRRMKDVISKRAVAKATAVTAATDGAAEAVARAHGRRPTVLPPAIFAARWQPREQSRSGEPRVFFPGSVETRSDGVAILIAALAQLVRRHPGLRLILPGERKPDWALSETPGTDVLADAIDMLAIETTYELQDAYRDCDVTVLPVMNDALGVPALESLACGVPVAAGAGDDTQPFVASGTGMVVPMGDVEALSGAVDACIDLARDEATSGRCRSHAECWDWTKVGPSYEDVYRSIARG